MAMPFYVPPEQMMKDRADYARKNIARGRDVVAFSVVDGIVIVTENQFRTLFKISEIYDRIAFAGVGKYNEFEMLRVAGVRQADMKGYSFSREDVNARALANAYGQTLGQVFTHEMKPYEVEILLAEVGERQEDDELYHILYDGIVMDDPSRTVLGGRAERIAEQLATRFDTSMDSGAAIRLGASVLSETDAPLTTNLEVAMLERAATGRAFRRITGDELDAILAAHA
ncbi:MAG: proteasome subunit alpha [Acidimicrobiia bacterium]